MLPGVHPAKISDWDLKITQVAYLPERVEGVEIILLCVIVFFIKRDPTAISEIKIASKRKRA